MIHFKRTANSLSFVYEAEFNSNNWVWQQLETSGSCTVSSAFYFKRADLKNAPTGSEAVPDDYQYDFTFGTIEGEYIKIPGRFLGIENDVLLPESTKLKRSLFVAERNISIFGRLADLIDHNGPIVIGGTQKGSIPFSVFEDLLEKFPNSYELKRYAGARVHTVLSTYLDGMKDARGRYEQYLSKKMNLATSTLDLESLKKLEIEKYILIRDVVKDALDTKTNLSEGEWQSLMMSFLLLLFPKYVKVLEKVMIHDHYSTPHKATPRYIDIALVDANGNLDIIEIKKPFEDSILRKSVYRGNSIPTPELSGSIMQAEKYLFHLTKWGVKGEDCLTTRYKNELPKGMSIRISNPKAIIIIGRDQIGGTEMRIDQMLDLEVIKRKYANIMDIITYDDLLRRLNNTIASLTIDTKGARTKS